MLIIMIPTPTKYISTCHMLPYLRYIIVEKQEKHYFKEATGLRNPIADMIMMSIYIFRYLNQIQ